MVSPMGTFIQRAGPWRLLLMAFLAAIAGVLVWLASPLGDPDGGRKPGALPKKIQRRLDQMSTERKIDAVLILGFEGRSPSSSVLGELRRHPPGGVFLGARNWSSPRQATALVAAIRRAARGGRGSNPAGPLIVAAQSGGAGRAFPQLPPARSEPQLGQGSPKLARRSAAEAGRGLRRVGVRLNLFPAADVATLAGPLASRSFGDDPALVRRMTVAALRGCTDARIGCAPGRFPGLGAVSQDTDAGPGTVGSSAEELEQRDLRPFTAAIGARVPAIVLSHAFYAAFDPVTPASLAPEVTTRLLRGKLHFQGAAITDDLSAGAIAQPPGEAAAVALAAGADMVLVGQPGQGAAVHRAIARAISHRELSGKRLDQAVGRALLLTQRLAVLR
jgi:beta-N-acetylhexosaminidase